MLFRLLCNKEDFYVQILGALLTGKRSAAHSTMHYPVALTHI